MRTFESFGWAPIINTCEVTYNERFNITIQEIREKINLLTELLKTERHPLRRKQMEIDLTSYKAIKHLMDEANEKERNKG